MQNQSNTFKRLPHLCPPNPERAAILARSRGGELNLAARAWLAELAQEALDEQPDPYLTALWLDDFPPRGDEVRLYFGLPAPDTGSFISRARFYRYRRVVERFVGWTPEPDPGASKVGFEELEARWLAGDPRVKREEFRVNVRSKRSVGR